MKIKVFFVLILSIQLISGCSTTKKTTIALVQGADTFVKYINQEELKKHLTVLASDEFEGRETAMPGQKKAALYIADYFETIGLKKGMGDTSYLQPFPVDVKDPYNVEISINNSKLTFLKDFFYFGNFADTLIKNAEVIYLGYGINAENYSDYRNQDVKGKVILIKDGLPQEADIPEEWNNWRRKLKEATDQGALAIMTIHPDFNPALDRIKSFIQNPRMQLHNKGNKAKQTILPNFFISEDIGVRYFGIDTSLQENRVLPDITITIDLRINTVLKSDNVIGVIEGTDKKDEVVVITAHYDHLGYDAGEVCNGADDDGSGTVAVMALAKAFAKAKEQGYAPRRTIVFMTVSGEEKGLLGSDYYIQNPVYPLEKTVVNLNIDMIGRVDKHHKDNNYVYLIGSDKISTDLHQISEQQNTEKVKLELDYTYNDENDPNRFYYRSDHYNFAKNNIPVIFYFSGVHEDYHKPTDDVDKIDFDKIEKTTTLVFYTAWEVANREKPLNKKITGN